MSPGAPPSYRLCGPISPTYLAKSELLGALVRPSFFTKAFAPALFAGGLSLGLTIQTELQISALFSALGLITFFIATKRPRHAAVASTTDKA